MTTEWTKYGVKIGESVHEVEDRWRAFSLARLNDGIAVCQTVIEGEWTPIVDEEHGGAVEGEQTMMIVDDVTEATT